MTRACADGQTPLSTAALHLLSQQCDPEICRLLISHGARFDIHTAAALGEIDRISALVKEDASQVNLLLNGFYPADYAAHCGQVEALRTLLRAGADPNSMDEWGQSLLSKCEHLPALRQLLMSSGGLQ